MLMPFLPYIENDRREPKNQWRPHATSGCGGVFCLQDDRERLDLRPIGPVV